MSVPEFVMNAFVPLIVQVPSASVARVSVAPASEPALGSVRPNPHSISLRRRGDILAGAADAPAFPARETAPDAPKTALSAGRVERRVGFDLGANVSTYETIGEGGLFGEGAYRYDEIDTSVSHDLRRTLRIEKDDPLSAAYDLDQTYEMGREGWRIRIDTQVSMRATASDFVLEARLSARENGQIVRERQFTQTIPRDLL